VCSPYSTGRRHTQGVGERLVVHKSNEMVAIQHLAEMSDARIAGKKFSVKSRELLLRSLQLLGEETKGLPILPAM